jgi:tetratricopeptide (TPR) repeat protein
MTRRIIQFNILAVTALMATLFPGGQALAEETYSQKASLLADIAVQYRAIGQSEQALKILDQALPLAQVTTNDCFKGTALVKVAGGYILAGQEALGKKLLAEAIQIARTQTATGCHVSATSPEESLLNRASEYAEVGYYDLAVEIITGVNNPVFTPIEMAEVAGHYAKAGEGEQATQVLNQALEMAQRLDDAQYKTLTLMGIASHLIQAGQTQLVPQVLELALKSTSAINEVQSRDNAAAIKLSGMLDITSQFAEVGQQRRAKELLDQTLPKIRTFDSKPFPLQKTLDLVVVAVQYAALEQSNLAVEILAEAQASAQAIDEPQIKNNAIARVAGGYAEIENFEMAQQIARSIKSVNHREQAFRGIVLAYAKAGDSEQALQLAKSIGSPYVTFGGIVRHYLQSGQYDLALEIVQQNNLSDLLSDVAIAYLEAGQPEQALKIAQSIQSASDTRHQKDGRFSAIAPGFAKQGDWEQALQVARSIKDKSYKAQALTASVEQHVTRERESKGLIQQILWMLTRRFNSLLGNLNDSNDLLPSQDKIG